MKLKAIIFDVDGTLADTEEIHRQAFNQTFEEYDLDWHWSVDDYHKLLLISGGKERFKLCLKQDTQLAEKIDDKVQFIRELHQRKSENYRKLLAKDNVQLRPGVIRLITEATKQNLKLAIATSSSRANLTTLINNTLKLEPEQLFSVIVTCDTVQDKKPSPIVYQCALAGLGLPTENCIAIEDTYNGNQAALNAGLKSIITTHRYTINDDFSGASMVINHLGEPNQPFTIANEQNCHKNYVDLELIDELLNQDSIHALQNNELPATASNLN